jgi:hypothetical protein
MRGEGLRATRSWLGGGPGQGWSGSGIMKKRLSILLVIVLLISTCGGGQQARQIPATRASEPTATVGVPATPTDAAPIPSKLAGLTEDQIATLQSLEQVDDYPLYTMHYYGAYDSQVSLPGSREEVMNLGLRLPWACSLFAALGDGDGMLFGRNFDWMFSPALLLFADPPDGYASVSMVDIGYLGFEEGRAHGLTDLPLGERRALLDAPSIPFDGMNERGLAVGMAAVPPGGMPRDPGKETIGSVEVIREILDHASTVDEAVAILQSYNVTMEEVPLHYLIADRSGRSVLVEFYEGKVVVTPNEGRWHLATNFLRASAGESAQGQCWRYDRIDKRLGEAGGRIAPQEAMQLLADVSQGNTQWSIVYGMSTGEITVTMARQYDEPHVLRLDLARGAELGPFEGVMNMSGW